MTVGLREAVSPAEEVDVRETLPVKPLIGRIVTVRYPGTPAFAMRDVGVTDIEKSTILTSTLTE